MNKDSEVMDYEQLEFEDKDLVMFTITNLKLDNRKDQVYMVISLKRKILTELLTTYLPTLLLLVITYATTFFKPEYFEASLTVNLTNMLVMTTLFTSKMDQLPPTSDTKMIDIWLILCLLVPFAFTLVQTAIEYYREEDPNNEKWAEASYGDGIKSGTELVEVTEVENLGGEVADNKKAVGMIRTLQWTGWPSF